MTQSTHTTAHGRKRPIHIRIHKKMNTHNRNVHVYIDVYVNQSMCKYISIPHHNPQHSHASLLTNAEACSYKFMLYMYVFVCMYTNPYFTHINIHTHTHIYIYICIYIYIYIYTYVYIFVYTYIYTHICMYVYLYTAHIYTHVRACVCTSFLLTTNKAVSGSGY